ncbi:hypothetical protein CALVIDRAFT_534503 [Calocera viscosa TUFC12733]|uniref:Uncharacterized protein n=1 Tax=Calocera viscosa (strain TUFC12733) TaxID=1330018 RepID=A0A167Q815_CALVF|nr:hypothetical protein CALVIDRAFT_534503 [Calocera viscosa TUFC12733]
MQIFNIVAVPVLLLASQVAGQVYGGAAPSSSTPGVAAPTSAASSGGASPSPQSAPANSGALAMGQLPFEATVGALILTGSVIALM